MLPAHGYPELRKLTHHLKGNFGTAWQNQQKEFADIPAPVLFTTNCLMPVRPSYADRVFTTEVVAYPGISAYRRRRATLRRSSKRRWSWAVISEDKDFTGINGGRTR